MTSTKPILRPILLLALLTLAFTAAEAHGQYVVFVLDHGPETVTAECPLPGDEAEQVDCVCTQAETTEPCMLRVYEIIRLFTPEGSSWLLESDALLLPEDGVGVDLKRDADGRPVINFPIGGVFDPPRPQPLFSTTEGGQAEMAFTIGYEKGAVDLVCPLPDDAEAEQMDCTCTQGKTTTPCRLVLQGGMMEGNF